MSLVITMSCLLLVMNSCQFSCLSLWVSVLAYLLTSSKGSEGMMVWWVHFLLVAEILWGLLLKMWSKMLKFQVLIYSFSWILVVFDELCFSLNVMNDNMKMCIGHRQVENDGCCFDWLFGLIFWLLGAYQTSLIILCKKFSLQEFYFAGQTLFLRLAFYFMFC